MTTWPPYDDGIGDIYDDTDDEFADDGAPDAPPTGTTTSQGPSQRPNGQMYYPRLIGGIEDVAFVRAARERRSHILFYGPPGTGKTALTEAACFVDALPREDGAGYVHLGFEDIVCSVDTTEGDFFGGFIQDPETGTYLWQDGPLLRALRYGIPLYVDEIFLCDTRVLASTLYPAMDGRTSMTVPMNPMLGRVPIPEGFVVIGTGNPHVPGANYSEALRSRMDHQIEVTTDWALARTLGVPKDIIRASETLDQYRAEGLLSWSPQLRDLLAYRKSMEAYGRDFAVADLLGKTPFDDRPTVGDVLSDMVGRPVAALQMGVQA